MDREQIKKFIPHREPMLLIDNGEATGEFTGRASYTVKGDEWFLQGHFPGNPVVPGVVLCEIMAQACCVILGEKIMGSTTYFTGIKEVRFKRQVKPGETVEIDCEITRVKNPFYFSKATGRVNGELCVTGEFSFALLKG